MSPEPKYYKAFAQGKLTTADEEFRNFSVEQRLNRLFEYWKSKYFIPKPKEYFEQRNVLTKNGFFPATKPNNQLPNTNN
jgi:hypothetical protein